MNSKEALEKLSYIPIYEEDIDVIFKGDLCEVYRNEVDIISKDLDRLEKLEKENERLKKAIDIFAKLIYLREHNKLKCLYTHECYYELLNEEYDLIIEVLENDK